MSKMKTTPVITVYDLADLFKKVTDQIALYDEELKGVSGWQLAHTPDASRTALRNIAAELDSWIKQGYAYAVTDRPFSDGDITGDLSDSIISQFGSVATPRRKEQCRVNPLKAAVVKQFGFDI